MAIIKACSSRTSVNGIINYVTKSEKTEKKLCSGMNCTAATVKEEMAATKAAWGKTDGRTYKHYVQSFAPGENVTPEKAHEIACTLASRIKEWQGFEVLIATHKDRAHVHTHFIVNSVSFMDGRKFHPGMDFLQKLRDESDELCRENGLTITAPGRTFEGAVREETAAGKQTTYQLLKRAEAGEAKSYVQDIAVAVVQTRQEATGREDFCRRMAERGIGVDWQDSHKFITFTDLERQEAGEKQCKIRHNKLEKYYNMDFGKEVLEHEFEVNRRIAGSELEREVSESERRDSEIERRGKEAQRQDREDERERLDREREREAEERARKRQEIDHGLEF